MQRVLQRCECVRARARLRALLLSILSFLPVVGCLERLRHLLLSAGVYACVCRDKGGNGMARRAKEWIEFQTLRAGCNNAPVCMSGRMVERSHTGVI